MELVGETSLEFTTAEGPQSLQKAYDSKAFLQLQQLFAESALIKRVLRLVFDNVVTFWASAFSEAERSRLVYSWVHHCPAIDVLYAVSETLTKLSSKSTLKEDKEASTFSAVVIPSISISDSTAIEHANQLSSLLIRFFGLGASTSEPGIARLLKEVLRMPAAAQRSSVWNQLLPLISSIPDKMFNIMKRHTDPRFRTESFLQELSSQLRDLLTSKFQIEPSFPFYSLWLAKLDSMGKLELGMNALNPILAAPNGPEVIAFVFERLPSITTERAILAFLSNSKVSGDRNLVGLLKNVFASLLTSSSTARFVVTEKLFSTCSLPWWVLRSVIDFLHSQRDPKDVTNWWMTTLEKMAATAGNSRFIKNEPYVRQRRLNRCLIYILEKGYVEKEELEVSQFMISLMGAVQELLNQPSQRDMSLGMRLGEAFSKILDPANALQFDGPRRDPDDEPDDAPVTEEEEVYVDDAVYADLETSLYLNPLEDYFSFLDHSYGVSSKKSGTGHPSTGRYKKGKFVQMSLDDDLSDVSEVKTPLYLRDCLTSLRSDDPKVLEVAMKVLAPLISSRPHDLPELAQSLASTLLHVINNFELDNFDQQKLEAMTALIEYEPTRVIPFLTSEFYAANYSIHERYVILDSLSEAAQNLSEHKVDPRPGFNPVALRALKFPKPAAAPSASIEVVEGRASSKPAGTTRRFASERKKVETYKNRLSPHIEQLLTLLSYKEPLSRLKMLMSEPRLLGKLIYAISVFVDCAGVSIVNFEAVARSILEVTWKMRYHEDPFVRRSLLLVNAAMVRNAPAWILFEAMSSEMNELVAWLENNKDDPDEEVRMLSLTVMMQLGRVYKDNPQYRPFEAPN